MISKFQSLSIPVKAALIVGLLVLSGLVWWLASPLFLAGPSANDTLDESDLTEIAMGNLVRMDSAHWGEGQVRLLESSDGRLVVHFNDVEIANGPSLFIYLSSKSNFSGVTDHPGLYVDLGKLTATSGNFFVEVTQEPNFEIGSVMIWCDPFEIIFTFAPMNFV